MIVALVFYSSFLAYKTYLDPTITLQILVARVQVGISLFKTFLLLYLIHLYGLVLLSVSCGLCAFIHCPVVQY